MRHHLKDDHGWCGGYETGWHSAILSFVRDQLTYECSAGQRRAFGQATRKWLAYWHEINDPKPAQAPAGQAANPPSKWEL